MRIRHAFSIIVTSTLLAGGCSGASRVKLAEQTGGSAALYKQFQAFDGRTGQPMSFAEVAQRCAKADVVFFGEMHSHAVCNAIEAQLFHALLQRSRPAALAMEFFEKDTQAALEAYLAGQSDETTFIAQTRQNRDYWLAHRPLIELCRKAGAPIIAANAPRRLVREYRMSKLPFEEFRRSRSPEDQRWLPRTSEHLPGPYFDRFVDVIRSHPPAPGTPTTAPALLPLNDPVDTPSAAAKQTVTPKDDPFIASFRPQLLWDDSMAESVADHRAAHPNHRVMLIVGRFHIASEGGTLQKFRQRRPNDRICTVVYSARETGTFTLDQEDTDSADIVICGLNPPEKKDPSPAAATMPSSAPSR